MAEPNRLETVRNLLEQRITPQEAIAILRLFPWDFEGYPVVIERRHVSNLLERFLIGTICSLDVATWAEAVEFRDDIKPEKEFEDCILQTVLEIANPTINGELTVERAQELLMLLTSE